MSMMEKVTEPTSSSLKQSFMGYSRLQQKSLTEKMNSANIPGQLSRLNKKETLKIPGKEKRKIISQIIGLSVVILALIILFLLLIFPELVHYTGVKNSENYTPETKQVKPQTPTFNAPTQNTKESQLVINGFGPASSQVQFIVNGETATDYLLNKDSNGAFSFTLQLNEGENTIQAYAIDNNKLESDLTKEYKINYDQTVPILTIDALKDGQEIVGKEKRNLTIKGETEAEATVLINAQQTKATDDGAFNLEYTLQDGDNQLQIYAVDAAGNQAETISLKIKFTP